VNVPGIGRERAVALEASVATRPMADRRRVEDRSVFMVSGLSAPAVPVAFETAQLAAL
jgi:hypothetical protein